MNTLTELKRPESRSITLETLVQYANAYNLSIEIQYPQTSLPSWLNSDEWKKARDCYSTKTQDNTLVGIQRRDRLAWYWFRNWNFDLDSFTDVETYFGGTGKSYKRHKGIRRLSGDLSRYGHALLEKGLDNYFELRKRFEKERGVGELISLIVTAQENDFESIVPIYKKELLDKWGVEL